MKDKSIDKIFSQLQAKKEEIIAENINNIIHGCFGKFKIMKKIGAIRTSIRCESENNIVLDPSLNVISAITHSSWNFRGNNCTLLYIY